MPKLLNFFKKKRTIEERVKKIQQGDGEEKERLIKEYIPFIMKTLSNQLNRYVDMENDDVFSIGLMAFNESIDKYEEGKGNFLTFASVVIKNRVIDQLRKESKISEKIVITQFTNEDDEEYEGTVGAVEGFEAQIELKADLADLINKMKAFDVSLDDLIKEAPKHKKTRATAIKIGRYIYMTPNLKEKFLKTKTLPITEITKVLHISKKVIQGSRKFIIAVILILESDLDTLKEYLWTTEGREQNDV
ncbi:RNA polymerase sigma-I factor [Natronincola ferrireducens]|uniref:RNA polymerase sigma factor SigI n=1 Tax=Natronincola ferrireducens TaxID=393762 RepID=A0A1G9FV50_9FIRM|nr:RNA polymerase sigma-I factor [Natronincola ferrireducens]SDK92238.1 RNA polymerase sigma factor [Natronincola ferrireducens]